MRVFQDRPYQRAYIEAIRQNWREGKRRQILVAPTGSGKCLGKGTPVIMYDGTVKTVESIVAGELLMGPDSTPRKVLSTCHGQETLYRITPTKGDAFVCNESHILSLKLTPTTKTCRHEVVNISVVDYLKKHSTFKHRAKLYRTGIDMPHVDVPLDPYFVGLWLADGTSDGPCVHKPDPEVAEFAKQFAQSHGLVATNYSRNSGKCACWAITTGNNKRNGNPVLDAMRSLSLIGNKHIPDIYIRNSREVRLQILAGILDGDGHMCRSGYEFSTTIESMADAVQYIARSLGFAANKNRRFTSCQTGATCENWRVHISGDCSLIPCRIARKKSPPRKQIKDVLVSGFKVENIGVGDYYGFEIDGDRLFLLGDFTVTHNTRTLGIMAQEMMQKSETSKLFVVAERRRLVEQLAEQMQQCGLRWHVEMANLPDGSEIGNEWVRRDPKARIWIGSRDTVLSRVVRHEWMGLPKFDLMVIDECITGDSIVMTLDGPVPIKSLQNKQDAYILSQGPDGPRYRRVSAFLKQGIKTCMKITLTNGSSIRCTPNHPIYTQRGWIEAGKVKMTDQVLCLADADVAESLRSVAASNLNSFEVISGEREQKKPLKPSIEKTTKNCCETPHCANADAANECVQCLQHLRNTQKADTRTSVTTCVDTQVGRNLGTSSLPKKNDQQFLGHCLETQAWFIPTGQPFFRDYRLTIQSSSQNGQDTSSQCLNDFRGENTTIQTLMDTEVRYSQQYHQECRDLSKYMKHAIDPAESESAQNGLMVYLESESHGGSGTTGLQVCKRTCVCTRKDSPENQLNSLPTGLAGNMGNAALSNAESTTLSVCCNKPERDCGRLSSRTYPHVCNTKWLSVETITENYSVEEVFDITVEEDHNFYANGMLVHNCHRFERGKSRELIEIVNAPYVLGMTATPCFADGTGLGAKNWDAIVQCVTMKELVEGGYLVPVRYFAPPELGKKRKKGDKTGIAGDPVSHWMRCAEGKRTVALFSGVKEAYAVRDRFREAHVTAEVIEADTPHKERNRIFNEIRKGNVLWCAGVGTLDTGVDIPEWEVGQILCRCGSLPRFRQFGGRIMRACPEIGKKYAILLDHSGATMEHGMLDEEMPWELNEDDDISNRIKKEREKGSLSNPVCCGNCGCLFAGTPVCPECGTAIPKRERKTDPDIERELLVELNAIENEAQLLSLIHI